MSSVLQVLGGLGLFLLGMSLLTEGLKALAGRSLRNALARYTRSPTSGAITGAITTAVVQSSSIAVITAVGFVGAKLLTFPQALGVIFGANIGTTLTGWIVVLIGFTFSLDEAMLPLVFVGALLHLFGRKGLGKFGLAIAGFGLVFVGIGMLQQGMAAAEQFVSPQSFPDDNFAGRLQLVLIGAAITVVTQSSSAGIATAIAAVSAGAISFPQAAAMAIGMDIGTTVTAALATIGGDTAVRRTGLAHVIYNLLTAIVAFALLNPYAWALQSIFPGILSADPEISLVGFHTFFNGLGVLLILPFTGKFARLIEGLFPEDESSLIRHLNPSLRRDEFLALAAARRTLIEITYRITDDLEALMRRSDPTPLGDALPEVVSAILAVDHYLDGVHTTKELGMTNEAHLTVLHALDHIKSLVVLCQKRDLGRMNPETSEVRQLATDTIAQIHESVAAQETELARLSDTTSSITSATQETRERLLTMAATGMVPVTDIANWLEQVQWFAEVASHANRVHHHLQRFPKEHRVSPKEQAEASALQQ